MGSEYHIMAVICFLNRPPTLAYQLPPKVSFWLSCLKRIYWELLDYSACQKRLWWNPVWKRLLCCDRVPIWNSSPNSSPGHIIVQLITNPDCKTFPLHLSHVSGHDWSSSGLSLFFFVLPEVAAVYKGKGHIEENPLDFGREWGRVGVGVGVGPL